MSNNNQTEPRKPMYLEITEPEKFDGIARTTFETTQRLAKRINKLFSTAFVDYHGSVIYNNAGNGNATFNQQFMVEIHFKPLTVGSIAPNDTRVRAFKPVDENVGDKSNVLQGVKSIYNNFRSTSKFQLTEEAAEILSEFILPGVKIDPFKPSTYDSIKAEYVDTPQYGQAPVMVKIINLDLIKLIKKIYGNKNESGNRVDYGIIPYGPVAPLNNANVMVQSSANWRLQILQINADKTFDMASEMGIIPTGSGSAGIVTGTV